MGLHWTALVTLMALLVYSWMLTNAGKARGKYKVKAPATDGPIEFQSALRVQANTVEQMVVFFPALWLCAVFLGDSWAALGGLIWVIGRIVYALGYYQAPAKRSLGFGITAFGTLALMIGAAIGLFLHWS
ncbi:MAG TPA: MAPEG family protein [Burkholderiaceae bacterium]|nr:MAPEG family protein [Burkholderiaceae bacterium]